MSLRSCISLVLILINTDKTYQQRRLTDAVFTTELFLNRDNLTAGLYEGEVKGRKRFGETQDPHGKGTIYYFTTDQFNRVNYTGDWRTGRRHGNGTSYFKDGAVYIGGYRKGLEDGPGFIRYPNGNTLDAEFIQGKIQGHGVFRYSNGDQREGFFEDNILDGQVIFTRKDGITFIERWVNGKQVEETKEDIGDNSAETGGVPPKDKKKKKKVKKTETSSCRSPGCLWRGGKKSQSFRLPKRVESDGVKELGQMAKNRARNFLLDVFRNVNKR